MAKRGISVDPKYHAGGGNWVNFMEAEMHLANISYRVGRTLTFDSETLSCVGDPEANRMFTRNYRKPVAAGGH